MQLSKFFEPHCANTKAIKLSIERRSIYLFAVGRTRKIRMVVPALLKLIKILWRAAWITLLSINDYNLLATRSEVGYLPMPRS